MIKRFMVFVVVFIFLCSLAISDEYIISENFDSCSIDISSEEQVCVIN